MKKATQKRKLVLEALTPSQMDAVCGGYTPNPDDPNALLSTSTFTSDTTIVNPGITLLKKVSYRFAMFG